VKKKILACLLAVVMTVTFLGSSATVALAQNSSALNPVYTYSNAGFTFEKISHPSTPVEKPDGIVDYLGQGKVGAYVDGVSAAGNGDRGQSYSYAAAAYGDWVYINTMYGGLGVSAILKNGLSSLGLDADEAKALMDVMYNGNMYYGEPDGRYAGGVLLKFNVKTGETKILMSRELNGLVPTFRNVCVLNGKMYFVGMVVDTSTLAPNEVDMAIAVQNGQPCLYEVDPKTDAITCVYKCVDMAGYRELVANNIFPSTRAVGSYKGCLVTGGIEKDGAFIAISANPSAGQSSFVRIAEMEDLFNYPAFKRTDVNAGGAIYQVIEYNNSLYVVICSGSIDTYNQETGTLRAYAIVRGDCSGDPTNPSSWTWTAVVGDEADGAKYPFGIDSTRVSAGACTLQIYGDHLYIGEYNDVSSALQNIALRASLKTQATNLQQSINLYRMDKNENIEMIVGDPNPTFPEGSLTGLGSGYGNHMNQYTWQTTVYEGKMYLSTMDTTTLLKPIAQFTNGDLFRMSEEEWKSQINYIRVLIELLVEDYIAPPIAFRLNREDTTPPTEGEDTTPPTEGEDTTPPTEGEDTTPPAEGEDTTPPTDKENGSDEIALTPIQPESEITEEMALLMIEAAIEAAKERIVETSPYGLSDPSSVELSLTEDQVDELVSGILDGTISKGQIASDLLAELSYINLLLDALTEEWDSTDHEIFIEIYDELYDIYEEIADNLPTPVKNLYNEIINSTIFQTLVDLARCIPYMVNSVAGFDLFEITENRDGSVSVETITNNGFGDRYNHGLRVFVETDDYFVIGTANPFYGTQLWRRANTKNGNVVTPVVPSDPTPSTPSDPTPNTPIVVKPNVGTGGASLASIGGLAVVGAVILVAAIAGKKNKS